MTPELPLTPLDDYPWHQAIAPFPLPKLGRTAVQFWAFKSSAGNTPTTAALALQLYALRVSCVDLSALVGQRVTVPGFENGQVEGGLPLLDVIRVRPL